MITIETILTIEKNASGFGLFGHEVRRPSFWKSYQKVEMIDSLIAKIANKLKLNKEQVFKFMDSKCGRWAGDSIEKNMDEDQISLVLEEYILMFIKELTYIGKRLT